jgi:cephalosporin hydroxylase
MVMKLKGHTSYHSERYGWNLTTQQSPNMFTAFRKLLETVRPSQILEIGTAGGGTTLYIRDVLDEIGLESTRIRSFEVKEHKWYPDMRNSNIEVIIENIFSHSYREIEKPNLVEDFIQSDGTTIVLCDGGSKINEFKILSKYLKVGDIIMAHDYIDSKENFIENYKDKIWNWREIGDEHIESTCDEYNLVSFMKDILDPAAWVCKKKI